MAVNNHIMVENYLEQQFMLMNNHIMVENYLEQLFMALDLVNVMVLYKTKRPT
jgi:hypothetical protein